MSEQKKLYRNTKDKMIAGVCAGVADYFSVDVTLVRLVTVLLAFAGFSGVLLYVVAAILIPPKP